MNFIELFQQYFPSFLTALGLTLQLALASLICASIIGIIFGMFSVSKNKILNIICKIYVDIIRGTPLSYRYLLCTMEWREPFCSLWI